MIVYTSADSVLQICGNEETFDLQNLYRCCEIGVLKQIVFREIVECPCRFLEDSELCFMLVTLAVDKPDPLLNISDERDALRRGLSLTSSGRPSGNPLLDAFLGVVSR